MAGNTFLVGAFGPVLPEIARTRGLADWQLGVVAGAFGFARMAGAAPAGILAGRHVALSLVLSPLFLAAGLLCLVVAPSFALLVIGRALMGIGHTLLMVGGITAILQDDGGAGASFRLNVFEFSGMLGILGGLALMGLLPAHWPWEPLASRRRRAAADRPRAGAGAPASPPSRAARRARRSRGGRGGPRGHTARRARVLAHARGGGAHGAGVVVGEPVPDPAARYP